MNEQFIFFWLSWLFVIIVYFFMEQRKTKHFFLFTLFLSIIFINNTITFFPYLTMSISFSIFFIASLIYNLRMPLNIYDLFVTTTISFTYVALLLWGKVAPIWFVIHPYLMIPLIITIFILILHETLIKQIAIISISLSVGQFIYVIILVRYQLQSNLDESFFIYVYIALLFLVITHLLSSFFNLIKRKFVKFNI